MDRIIEDKRWIKPRQWKYFAFGAFIITVVLYVILRDNTSTLRVDREKVTISEAFYGPFEDYIRINGHVKPIRTVYITAMEAGIVEKILTEEGTMVEKGDGIVKLANQSLNMDILNSEAQVAEKANLLRETRISMKQKELSRERELLQLKFELRRKKRTYQWNKELYEDGAIPKEEYIRAKEDYELARHMMKITRKQQKQDSIFLRNQIRNITRDLKNMRKNLQMIYQRKENLKVKAPVDGQLGMLDVELGKSVSSGQSIGQINVLSSYKINASIDEHYIDRIRIGLTAHLEREEDTFRLTLKKVYPEVRDGSFEVDLEFAGRQPENIRTGQSYNLRLKLGETEKALQVPRGGFFQSTGGRWIYQLSDDGSHAVRKPIRIWEQNPRYYEVTEGLEAGDKVITSGYETFGKNERLVFE
mgnify:FL=1